MMNNTNKMSSLLVLFLWFALATASAIRVTPMTPTATKGSTYTSICPTQLRVGTINSALKNIKSETIIVSEKLAKNGVKD